MIFEVISCVLFISIAAFIIGHWRGCCCGCNSKWRRTIQRFGLEDETKEDE